MGAGDRHATIAARTETSMAERIRWGILGTGDINRKLLRGARLSDAVEVVAVASRDPERAAGFAREHHIPRCR